MYQIENFPEVWVDACLRDSEGRFLFLSIYGRDTALLQFMAAMELPRAENGLDRFTLIDPATSERHAVDVAGTERLSKLSTRLPKDTVFGALTQTWIYDTAVATPDIVNRQGWALTRSAVGALPPVFAGDPEPMDTPEASADLAHPALAPTPLDDRLWALMKHLAPVPLLDPWRNGLMALAREAGMIRPIGDSTYPALGPVTGGRVSLDDRFLPMVRDLVASGAIVLPPLDLLRPSLAAEPPRLRRAALGLPPPSPSPSPPPAGPSGLPDGRLRSQLPHVPYFHQGLTMTTFVQNHTPTQARIGAEQGDSNAQAATTAEPTAGEANAAGDVLPLADFISEFGTGLLQQVRLQNPPVYTDRTRTDWDAILDALSRRPFDAQREAIHAACTLLLDQGQRAAVLNAEMGTGKTMMAIAAAAIAHAEGLRRTLVISPPHLVFKWRREIKDTIPGARVWILNGPDTLRKLLMLRAALSDGTATDDRPEFFILGRVRMRMGFHWRPAFAVRHSYERGLTGDLQHLRHAACPRCGEVLSREDADGHPMPISIELATVQLSDTRSACLACQEPLWTLVRPGRVAKSYRDMVSEALQQMPTIGLKTAERLLDTFGEELLGSMLGDNVYEFLYLMDEGGNLVFTDRQAQRMERALAGFEFSLGDGGYQASEFIKRYLPQGYFGLMCVDEGHEYKVSGSAQGQAMGVLASKCRKTLLLTGTLMGGYADDLFHLLWRVDPAAMLEDGYRPNANGSMAGATMHFMRDHGVLKDIFKETSKTSHRTAKGNHVSHRVAKAPGFGPKGIMRYVLPITVFLKLRDIGQNVLPAYREIFTAVDMTEAQRAAYDKLSRTLVAELRAALRVGDTTLLGVVLNALLAWPDCCFRDETVCHPRTRRPLALQPAIFADAECSPKEAALIDLCKRQKALHRKVLVYTVYTGVRDTAARLKALLDAEGFKTAVMRASLDASKREDWIADQVDRGVDVVICNPELVKTGLDLLDFPTIVFVQSGFNVYTMMQAARRSWRIGQRHDVEVHFLGYNGSAQMDCLTLMAKKVAVTQSTAGDMPESGLDILNDAGESVELALARQLLA